VTRPLRWARFAPGPGVRGLKILIVSDFHYALPQFDWLLEAAPNYDLVIYAGDLLDTNAILDPGAQIVVVQKYLRRLSLLTQLIVCSGNHDLDAAGPDGERRAKWIADLDRYGIPTDGESLTVGDLLITICPWWDGPEAQKAIATQLAAAEPHRAGRQWMWVYHAPPPETPISWSGQRYFGDAALVGWMAQHSPDYVVSGHVHEAPFVREGSWVDRIGGAWVFNAGKQIGAVPTTIVIDTDAKQAVWFSLDGVESVRLDAPLERPVTQLSELPQWMAKAADPA